MKQDDFRINITFRANIDKFIKSVKEILDTSGEITGEDIERLKQKFSIDNKLKWSVAKRRLKKLLKSHIVDVLINRDFSEEADRISRLMETFGIKDRATLNEIVEEYLWEVVKDYKFDKRERANFEAFSKLFDMEEEAKKIFGSVLYKAINNYISKAISDGKWSPEEEEMLFRFSEEFGVKVHLNSQMQELFERLRFVWKVQNDALEPIPVRISLKRGEKAFFKAPAEFLKWSKKVKYHGYAGPHLTFRVAKGIYLTYGGYKRKKEVVEEITKVDNGTIYITNKRLIFLGRKKTVSVNYSKILNLELDGNRLTVFKDSGNPLIFDIIGDADTAYIIASRYAFGDV